MAKRLEGRPFHLLAAHCQRNSKENVVGYIKSKGLEANTPNFTVSSFGGHPKVKGNGYVPYYMVFDHTGKLVHHHMCGDYHGGDGLKMIELVNQLLMRAPEIYLGEKPFELVPKLAAQIARKKKLAGAVKQVEAELAARPEEARRAELQRLLDAVQAYRDGRFGRADRLMATDPTGVVPLLKHLSKELKGTQLGQDADKKLAEAQKSADLKLSISIYKSFQKAVKRIEKMKEPSKSALEKQAKKLEKLIDGHENLPISATIRAYIGTLR